jgi:dTDP-4-dehydrorhamnose reductase
LKVLITGAGGMVGSALKEYCQSKGDFVLACDHSQLDIADTQSVSQAISRAKPDAVINCAAWTNVDGCESEPDRAFAANALGPENLAAASRDVNAHFITISTDYVFDGTKEGFYTQEDQPNPQSVYARSKLEGEQRAKEAYPGSIIVRTGFICGPNGTNFLSTVIRRVLHGERIKAITDSYGTPTYSHNLAIRLRELAQLGQPRIFHVVNSGDGASYEEFSREAMLRAGLREPQIEGILTESLHRPAARPRNSRLRCLYSEELGLAPLPDWREALNDFVKTAQSASGGRSNP